LTSSLIAGLVAAAMTLAAPAAVGAPLPDGGATAAEVAAALQAKGYAATLGTDSVGDPKITSAAEGSRFVVLFYGCRHGPRCTSIEFSAAFHVEGGLKLTDINSWSRRHRFGRAYLDQENDPYIQMDLDVEHGFTSEAIENNIDTWDSVLAAFRRMLLCASKPADDPCKADNR